MNSPRRASADPGHDPQAVDPRPMGLHPVRWRLRLALVLCVVGAWPDAGNAATVSVGLDAGQPGSACQFGSVQAAIAQLPPSNDAHVIELQGGNYVRQGDSIRVAGHTVRVITTFAAGSGCQQRVDDERALIAPVDPLLEGGRQILVHQAGSLELQRVEVAASSNGGALVRDSRLILRDSRFRDHRTPAQSSGAAVVVEGGQLILADSLLDGNRAGANGGAVFCARGASHPATVSVTGDTRFIDNRARHGGAIYLFRGCSLSLSGDPLFEDNLANADGGAIATEPNGGPGGDRNGIAIHAGARFIDNNAGGRGGALSVSAGNTLQGLAASLPLFDDNTAGSAGGALFLSGAGEAVRLAGARFVDNRSLRDGGAIAVHQRDLALLADCNDDEGPADHYCAGFEGNLAATSQANAAVRGGAVFVDGGAQVRIDGYAFRRSRGPQTLTDTTGGVVAAVAAGDLHLANALVFDTDPDLTPQSHLFLVRSGGRLRMDFTTVVDTPGGAVLVVQPGGEAHLVGTVIAGNAVGVVNSGGTLAGTCNNVQLGAAAAPLDPGFISTPEGRYRLGGASAMRDRGLTCNPSALPPGFVPPLLDLVGRRRVEASEPSMAIDLGAIEFRERDERLFGDGFEGAVP